jgi:hypothetical protein
MGPAKRCSDGVAHCNAFFRTQKTHQPSYNNISTVPSLLLVILAFCHGFFSEHLHEDSLKVGTVLGKDLPEAVERLQTLSLGA